MASNNQNINPRPCVYNCGIQIYWNTSVNEYWEVFTKKKHICYYRGNKSPGSTTADGITPPSDSPKPLYYNPVRKRTPHATSLVQHLYLSRMKMAATSYDGTCKNCGASFCLDRSEEKY